MMSTRNLAINGRVSVVIQQGQPESHRVIWIYDLENARPSIF